MCSPSSTGRGPWEHQPEEHCQGTASPRCSSSRLLPGTRGTKAPAQCTMQPLKSRLQQEAQGGWEGLPSPQAPQSLHCQASAWKQSSSLPLCRLLHAYQAVAHSWHSKTQIHSLVLVGVARAEEEGREHPRNQAAVLAPSLTDLASQTGLPRGKGFPTQPLSAVTSVVSA